MRYPEFLKDKGRIGFIAPSFGAVIEPYHTCTCSALKRFESMGYENVIGPNAFESVGIGKSNTAKKCADEINDFFINDRSDVIISVGGGETMCEDLTFVDFDAIAKAVPKWYMGYSDNTNLVLTLPTICDTAAIYGPCASSFGMSKWHPAIEDAYELLRGEKLTMHNYDKWELAEREDQQPLDPYNATEDFCMTIAGGKKSESFSGRLLGGCIDVLSILCGTRFDKVKEFNERYAADGTIWFLEACELNPVGIRRILWQLKEAGWFDTAKGFLIGRPMLFNEEAFGNTHIEATESILGEIGVPIIHDVDLGHLPPMMPLIAGAVAEVAADVNADGNKLRIKMRLE